MADAPPALVFDTDFAPQTGRPVEVLPGVLRITAPNAGPFTFTGTNSFLLGHDRLAVLDPGPDDPAHRQALLKAEAAQARADEDDDEDGDGDERHRGRRRGRGRDRDRRDKRKAGSAEASEASTEDGGDEVTLEEFHEKATVGLQSTAGFAEGRPLHTSW